MIDHDVNLALLGPSTLAAYLERLGVKRPERCDLAAVTMLQAAHLRSVPFHNLALLAAAGRDPGLPPVSEAVEGAVRGHGGTCHVLSPPFVVLLRSLGFEAHLAAASVRALGDHLVAIVHIGGRRWLCDVANGHPYLKPFPLDPGVDLEAAPAEQLAYGWRFRIEPVADASNPAQTHRVRRLLPDGTWKVVYTLDPQMVPYVAFARIIAEHHTRIGFGPFLSGLRAVRITAERLLCLRDCWLERYGAGPPGRRFLPSADAVGTILSQYFDLGDLPWQGALHTLQSQTRRWWPAGPVPETERVHLTVPPLRLVVSVGLMDRPGGLWTLGQGLLRDGLAAKGGLPGAGILAFENSSDAACVRDNFAAAAALCAAGLPTEIGQQSVGENVHQRLLAAGLCADKSPPPRVGIATSRMIQVGLLADFFQRPRPPKGLSSPHPLDGNGPVAVWMLDDDLRLERLELAGQRLSCTPLVDLRRTLDHLYREYPEISVLVGGNTGCPPIPGFCFLYTQIVDIAAHVKSASQQDPNAPYRARSNPRHLPDYYYDTSESGDEHLALAFDWEPDAASASLSVREALLSHLRAFSNLLHGQPATRLLVHHPDLPISPTTARGGNAIFFDLDALFAAPYLSIPLADGIKSRRGDTVWAHLAAAVSGVSVYQAPFAVHHVRHAADGSGPSLGQSPGGSSLEQFILAQIGGVVLSRLVAAQLQGREASPLVLLEQRIGRVRTAFSAAVAHIESFSAARYRERTELWWARMQDRAVLAELARLTEVLEILRAGVLSFAPTEELQTIVKSLAGAMSTLSEKTLRWRSLWT